MHSKFLPSPWFRVYPPMRLYERLVSRGRQASLPASFLLTICCLLISLLGSVTNSYGQTCPGCNQTANEVSIKSSRLILPNGVTSCDPGEPISATLGITIGVNGGATRYSVYLTATLQVGNNAPAPLELCSPSSISGSKEFFIPIQWTCGSRVTIKNPSLVWGINSSDNLCPGGVLSCTGAGNPKCDTQIATYVVDGPLVANFTSATSCIAGNQTQSVTFTNITTGGTTPYSFTYSYGDGTTEVTSSTLVTHQYTTTGTKSVTLTVRDANGIIDTQVNPVEVGSCCQFAATCIVNNTVTEVNGCDINALPPAETNPAAIFSNITTQPCGTLVLIHSDAQSGTVCPNGISVTRTYTLIDDLNNNQRLDDGESSATCVRSFLIIDRTRPTWVTAAGSLNRTVQCSDAAGLTDAQALAPAAQDNCGFQPLQKTTDIIYSSSCPESRTITNTWVVTDNCGNVSETNFTQTIIVEDTQAPTLNQGAALPGGAMGNVCKASAPAAPSEASIA
ncbi:PKD domain-containing protein, partial [Nibrella saemangeumensis]|uniref:PKD domain-containing protein n=1 Tax=Nibrella saemangeumensis TaxID=1084526 RepID=UPI003CD06CB0